MESTPGPIDDIPTQHIPDNGERSKGLEGDSSPPGQGRGHGSAPCASAKALYAEVTEEIERRAVLRSLKSAHAAGAIGLDD